VRYTRWDLSTAILVDPHSNTCLDTLYPQDKSKNADALRRTFNSFPEKLDQETQPPSGIAPLLKTLMAEYAATGLPPAYVSKKDGEKL
jgi:hypothetical protein